MSHQLTKAELPRILVVDDEEVHRKIVGNVAIQCGFNVVYAGSVEAAIESISAHSFDCITVDLSLGERDGIELLRLIGSTKANPRVIERDGSLGHNVTAQKLLDQSHAAFTSTSVNQSGSAIITE